MGLPASQRRMLERAEAALRLSDPRLAALFSLFSRLNTAEEMPVTEQVRSRVMLALAPVAGPLAAFWRWFASPRRARLRTALFLPVALGLVASAVLIGTSYPTSSSCPQALRTGHEGHASAGPRRPGKTCAPRAAIPALGH